MDRNQGRYRFRLGFCESLSARRAWIEIIDYIIDYATDAVALRKESVDRNGLPCWLIIRIRLSLSARRAWIEMACRVGLLSG